METAGYLIDSNVIIDYLNQKLPTNGLDLLDEIINTNPKISIINKIEILGFHSISNENLAILEDFINSVEILPVNDIIANQTIELKKTLKIKLPDALIAATSIVFNLTLITRNKKDFKNIPNLKFINPHEI